MSDDPKQNWTDEEAAMLRSLRDEPVPSAGVEDRVVDALKQSGRIRARGGRMVMVGRTAGLVAAAAVVFFGGFALGNRNVKATDTAETAPAATETAAAPTSGENQYMLLMFVRADPGYEPSADVDYTAIVEEYRQWALDRAAEGRLVDAHKLAGATRVMTAHAGNVAIASAADSDRTLGGYFLITAGSLEEAVEISRSHPHLKYGGEVEVRPIEVTSR